MCAASSTTPHATTGSGTAREALDHIAGLYVVEGDVRGRPPDERRRERQARAGPLVGAFRRWLDVTGPKLSRRSDLAIGVGCALTLRFRRRGDPMLVPGSILNLTAYAVAELAPRDCAVI